MLINKNKSSSKKLEEAEIGFFKVFIIDEKSILFN